MDENKLYTIDSALAQKLLALYYGYKNGTIQERNTTLSQADFLRILKFVSFKAGWGQTEEEIIKELDKIVTQDVQAKTTIPGNLRDLLKDLDRLEELEKERQEGKDRYNSLKIQTSLLIRDFERTATPEDQERLAAVSLSPSPPKDAIAELFEKQDKEILDTRLKDAGVPDAAIEPLVKHITNIVQRTKNEEQVLTREALESVVLSSLKDLKIIQEGKVSEQVESVVEAFLPIIRKQAPEILTPTYDIGQRLAPQRFTTSSAKKEEPESAPTRESARDKSRREQRVQWEVMLLLRAQPAWKDVVGQLSSLGRIGPLASFFKTEQQNSEQITSALTTIKTRYPDYYRENERTIQTLIANARDITPTRVVIEKAEFVPPQDIEKKAKDIEFDTGARILKLEVNPSSGTVEALISSPGSSSGFTPIRQFAQDQIKSRSQDAVSSASIKLRQLFTNPSLRIPRIVIGGGLMLGSFAIPFPPLQVAAFLTGGALGMAELAHSPRTLSAGVVGLSNLTGGLQNLGARLANFQFVPPKMPGWAMGTTGGVIAAVLILPLLLIFITQSTFLPEGGFTNRQSQYITVTKTTRQTSFQNDSVPDSILFRITVTPNQGTLERVRITDETKALGKTIESKNWELAQLSEKWEQEYIVQISPDLKKDLKDTQIANTVTVTANVVGIEGVQNPQTSSYLLSVNIGTVPDDCPSGWPTTTGWINQGPYGTATHTNDEAIDIHGTRGTPIYATFKGTTFPFDDNYNFGNGYGRNIELHGVCNGKPFIALYAHFLTRNVQNGQSVNKGDLLGTMDCTGWCTNDHLHYQLRGLPMAPPYIPTVVPKYCVGPAQCGNIRW